MSPSMFLVCLFLIAACTEGAVIDKEKEMNDTALLQLLHHINKRHNIPLEPKQTSSCTMPDLPSGCSESEFVFSVPSASSIHSDSYLSSLNSQYSRICTSDCAGAIGEYYRCLYSGDAGEYFANYIQKYICGQQGGDYCPVRVIRSFRTTSNVLAFSNMYRHCSISSTTGISSCSCTSCTSALRTFSSTAGCCTEPFLGSGVSSCSGVSVSDACTGVSSATGIIATPIVAVSLMILALAGVFL
ncbi:PREDICTED: uncharacterized protein LOC109580427 isoform X3 [Amphimedon queenslandica]|uniref:Uncharacterized protein n=1 Tax=Amphimedon queenslandica TaxID=400682 RepID=A0AAN0IXC7_AMPQE|nr:PREDICTED: uncharacterized protein LOC109580427 isoform X3 [Amphimedon queenslandica]|eukprot:XP_019849103.1 PREDICTED: uncharacterized protein LOC109580427 isoform X3 [Amphimedon queenslandica]